MLCKLGTPLLPKKLFKFELPRAFGCSYFELNVLCDEQGPQRSKSESSDSLDRLFEEDDVTGPEVLKVPVKEVISCRNMFMQFLKNACTVQLVD